MYDLILFDMDGTIMNSEEGITKSVKYALEGFGIHEEKQENLKRFIGPPLIDGFMEFYGMTREDALGALARYRERYTDVGVLENKLIDDAEELLKALKNAGKRLALATSKPHVYARQILKNTGVLDYFEILVGAEFDGTRNDKAEVIEEVLRQAGEYKSPVMIGDRKHDIEGAKKNGLPCIGVSFGYAPEGELEEYGAVAIADDMNNLLEILLT